MCVHRFLYGHCKTEEAHVFCEMGRRFRTYFVLTGSVIAVWPILEKALMDSRGGKMQHTSYMQIVRIRTADNQKLVGLVVMPQHVRTLLATLTQVSQQHTEKAAS